MYSHRTARTTRPLLAAVMGTALIILGTPIATRAATAPRPVAVYIGFQLIASGQSLSAAISRVYTQVPFTIKAPTYLPTGYSPVQLAVIPRQRAISNGASTLTFATSGPSGANFTVQQAAQAIQLVGGSHIMTVTVGSAHATLHEITAPRHDLLLLSWTDGAGNGYEIATDAALSHLTPTILSRIGASLH